MVGAPFTPGPSDTAPLGAVGARPPGPPPAPARDTRALLLKGAGLVAIAVVSGLLWFLIRHEDKPEPVAQPPANAGEFAFAIAEGPIKSTDCVAKSYNQTQKLFQETPCVSLSRALFTTETGGAKALVSVALVTMPDAASAARLKALTEKDGTGNVTDLVKDGTYKAPGAPRVSAEKAAFASKAEGTEVTIVLADFFAQHKDAPLLKRIATDAVRLAAEIRK
ncbi:hypothetical protein [Amycolatopsis samaneae]|uniref:PknH-like extracellular domain-containing protein n=1 Tax=Amycolatopsis samaneae TaxID=664691 RepID=A0ABW5GXR2_9PSEU